MQPSLVQSAGCAAFTIEMRQNVGIDILIISFPQGPRAALQLGARVTRCKSSPFPQRRDEKQFGLSTHLQMAFQKKRRKEKRPETSAAGRDLCRRLRFWFICLLLTMGETGKHGTRVTSDSPSETRWREDGSSVRRRCGTPPVSKSICISC